MGGGTLKDFSCKNTYSAPENVMTLKSSQKLIEVEISKRKVPGREAYVFVLNWQSYSNGILSITAIYMVD